MNINLAKVNNVSRETYIFYNTTDLALIIAFSINQQ